MTAARQQRTQRPFLHSVQEIGDGLRARLPELITNQWGLRGYWDGNEFVAFNPLRNDRHLGSFRLVAKGGGALQGLIRDFAMDKNWSPLEFESEFRRGGPSREAMGRAIKWAAAWLGYSDDDPGRIAITRKAIEQRDQRSIEDEEEQARKRAAAKKLYLSGTSIYGTHAETYLLGRGIPIRKLDVELEGLRYHPALHYTKGCSCGGDPNYQGKHLTFPGMMAAIIGPTGNFLSCHRTFLQPIDDGRVVKADVSEAKLSLGRYKGHGLIRLWAGTCVDPKTGEIRKQKRLSECKPRSLWIEMTEGIENGLTIAYACQELRVVAGVSGGNMTSVRYPEQVAGVTFWRDNDAAGSAADRALEASIANAQRQGLEVEVATVPATFKDTNDALQGKVRHG
jgi:hypothetical protein